MGDKRHMVKMVNRNYVHIKINLSEIMWWKTKPEGDILAWNGSKETKRHVQC